MPCWHRVPEQDSGHRSCCFRNCASGWSRRLAEDLFTGGKQWKLA